MNTNRLLNAVLLGSVLAAWPLLRAQGRDKHDSVTESERLLPFTESFDPDLRPVFDQKLIQTSANYGRMIRMHGGTEIGDSVVSVSCGTADVCHVTLTKAKRDLDLVMAEHRADSDPLEAVRQVPVTRKDASIPKDIASIFKASLERLFPISGDHRVETVDGWGFDRIEFWLDGAKGKAKKGEAQRRPNVKVKSLINIGNLLSRYAEANQTDRGVLEGRIKKEGLRILGGHR